METKKKASVAWPWPWPWKETSLGWVCQWSLCACLQQLTRAATFGCSMALPDLKLLTPAQAANVLALHDAATLWFSVPGAVAAVLAMLLEGRAGCRTTQWALACVALASAVAIHCVITWFTGVILVTAPSKEGLLVASVMVAAGVVFFAALDANTALILLRRRRPGGEAEEVEPVRPPPGQEKQSMEP